MRKCILLCLITVFSNLYLFSQDSIHSGYIIDENSNSLESVSIIWQNTGIGTYTDRDGYFQIDLSPFPDSLVIEFMGYHTRKIPYSEIIPLPVEIILKQEILSLPPFEVIASNKEILRLIPGKSDLIILEDLTFTRASDISEVLKYLPDMQLIANGTGGSLKTIKMNGFSSSHVAFQLDGMPLNSAQNGGVDLSLVNAQGIERIGIKYGGNSVDAGSSAMGGIINLSILPEIYNSQTSVTTGIGSFDNYQVSAIQTMGSGSKTGFKAGVYYRTGEDNYTYNEFNREKQVYNSFFRRTHLQLGGALVTGQQSLLKIMTSYYDGFTEIPSASPYNKSDQNDRGGMFRVVFSTAIHKNSILEIGSGVTRQFLKYNNHDIDLYDEYTNDLFSTVLNYRLSGEDARWRIISRLESNYYRLESTQIAFHDELNLRFAVAGRYGYTIADDIFTVFSGGLSSGYTGYDNKIRFDYRLGLKAIWSLMDLYTSLYTGYKIPTFNDRYWPSAGNPDLRVENVINWISGTTLRLADWIQLEADITLYEASDMIRWIPTSGMYWSPANLDNASGRILAAKIRFDLGRLNLAGGITYQQVEKDGAQLRYVPRFIGSFQLIYKPFENLKIFAGNIFESDRPLVDGGLQSGQVLARYGVLDMGIDYRFHFLNFLLKANNITGEQYYLQSDLPMKGRNYEFSIRITI